MEGYELTQHLSSPTAIFHVTNKLLSYWPEVKNMVAVVVSQEAFISFERLNTSEIHICYLFITAHCKSEQWTHILLIAEICLAHFHAREKHSAMISQHSPNIPYPKADQSVIFGLQLNPHPAPCLCAMKSIILAHPTVLHFLCPVSTAIEPIGKSLRWRCLNHMCYCAVVESTFHFVLAKPR